MAKNKNESADDIMGDIKAKVAAKPTVKALPVGATAKVKPSAKVAAKPVDKAIAPRGKKSAISDDTKLAAGKVEAREGSVWEAAKKAVGAGSAFSTAFKKFKFVQPRGGMSTANPEAFFRSVVTAAVKKGLLKIA